MGRHSTYTDAIAQEICERLATGEPLAQICRDERMPPVSTVYDWKNDHEAFGVGFARAREAGFDQIAMDALNIANTPQLGEIVTEKADGTVERRQEDMLGHRRLQIETRLKLLAKWDYKRYGERVTHAGDQDNPVAVNAIVRRVVDPSAA